MGKDFNDLTVGKGSATDTSIFSIQIIYSLVCLVMLSIWSCSSRISSELMRSCGEIPGGIWLLPYPKLD